MESVHVESMWSLCRVHVESMWSPLESNQKNMQFFGVHMESMWSPCGVSVELWSPRGVHENSMGHSKVLSTGPLTLTEARGVAGCSIAEPKAPLCLTSAVMQGVAGCSIVEPVASLLSRLPELSSCLAVFLLLCSSLFS
jgi:hypothetical protein